MSRIIIGYSAIIWLISLDFVKCPLGR